MKYFSLCCYHLTVAFRSLTDMDIHCDIVVMRNASGNDDVGDAAHDSLCFGAAQHSRNYFPRVDCVQRLSALLGGQGGRAGGAGLRFGFKKYRSGKPPLALYKRGETWAVADVIAIPLPLIDTCTGTIQPW